MKSFVSSGDIGPILHKALAKGIGTKYRKFKRHKVITSQKCQRTYVCTSQHISKILICLGLNSICCRDKMATKNRTSKTQVVE
jgi:hypothetical protein